MSILINILVIGIILFFTYKTYRSIRINILGPWAKAPPGPSTYPFLGAIPSLLWDFWGSKHALKSPIDFFDKLHEIYGEDFRLHNGVEDTIILSSLNAIREFSNHPNASFRPFNRVLMDIYSDGKDLGMGLGTGGERWKFLRRFSSSAFKSLSGGTLGLNKSIDLEVSEIVADLREKAKTPPDSTLRHVNIYFDIPILNIIWYLVAGRRYNYGDPAIQKQFDYLKVLLEEPLIAPLTIIPFALYIPPLKRIYNGIRDAMNSFRILLSEIVEERRKENFTEEKKGFIDLFLKAQLEDKENPYLSNEDLVMCCQDFFLAGAETSSKTLCAFILYMILYPDVQEKAAKEIRDAIQSKDIQIKSKHRHLLPYTDAVLMEVRRYATPFPITPFRCSNRDICINGFNVPANVPVQVNLNGVLRSKYCWKEADIFNPSRFLNEKGGVDVPNAFMPFGFGKRRCIGEDIGNISNFLIVSNMLHNFKFSASSSNNKDNLPSIDRFGGIIQGYEPFDVRIELR